MSEYQLHSFAQSGNAYKVALLLELAGADWEPVWVDFFHGGTKTPDYLAMNEMGEAPVLVHGDLRLSQSGVILDYLAQRYRDYAPKSEEERREVLRWLLWDNHKFTSYIATLRFLMTLAAPDKRDPAVIAFLDGRARAAMKVLDRHLGARPWIVGERMTIADFSCAGYVYYAEEYGVDMAGEYPGIERWRNEIAALPGWKHPYDLLPGHPPGG
ncbi:glutathione S-transferase family protein [Amaricoccus solimangrovi]|uniref:Glutathione S-transferase family protein n=1 Tax=Amaricoccus solimangrovi TaxID=2589815 RepID=A0A501WV28_9RHOB|nr:glutathione S-transferase family protein [Amaricoccus solimangrovi]TPE52165.1 glutathione S-transferase family protein [Amaricoccus solimangrovi]